jgi:hypothetical protein
VCSRLLEIASIFEVYDLNCIEFLERLERAGPSSDLVEYLHTFADEPSHQDPNIIQTLKTISYVTFLSEKRCNRDKIQDKICRNWLEIKFLFLFFRKGVNLWSSLYVYIFEQYPSYPNLPRDDVALLRSARDQLLFGVG